MLINVIFGILTFYITCLSLPILKKYLLVEPNKRSSHNVAKPTAGGIVFASLISFAGYLDNYYITLFAYPLYIGL